jgi:flagellar biosynthesis protein
MANGKWIPGTFLKAQTTDGKKKSSVFEGAAGKKGEKHGQEQEKTAGEKDKTAVALAYEPGEDAAPRILATGKGQVADRIIATAQENQVPLYQDNKLANTLSKMEIGDAIPPELYEVVAEILVFVDGIDKMKAKLEK